ncbi:MAG: type I-C CRISPR-associated protein Cas8c/Csd1 [Deltaproteobacteria bacterium]|nr:type I-C CRISPR-associated protein Cas8c/Csd1 [Deltaproteobacteria bacterium]MBN2673414.1 type I-C CRISPR-associated protein Cas8c/Csd1 [Deltaproteobacteria bacterium]
MSWLATLYETYNRGILLDLPGEKLMPVNHTLQNAHINIVIDGEGNFKRASVLEKTQVVLPATEKSAGRSSGEAPHPLADKIQYVAKDYPEFGGKKKSYYDGYHEQLRLWCESKYRNEKAIAVYRYTSKGNVVSDLVNCSVLHVDENSMLMSTWTDADKEAPKIYKVLPKNKGAVEQGDALICWSVEIDGELNSSTWTDSDLHQSWISYDGSIGSNEDFCFVRGEHDCIAENHPAKLRHTGDKAKLISSNDSSGFTFRGRFADKDGSQAARISFDVTQKAHNALRWLISRQGFRNGDQVFVSWAISGKETPEPLQSSYNLFSSELIFETETPTNEEASIDHSVDIGESFSNKLKKYLAGYSAKLDPNEQIVIMGLDSATPGRMGIIYYRQLLASEFLGRIESWHRQFAWFQRHTIEVPDSKGKKKPKSKTVWPISSPAPRVIADAAYGAVLKSNDTLKKSVIERIMPCIVDGRPIPRDILESAVRRASNRNNCEHWEWERNMGVTCALYRGYFQRHPNTQERREYKMALEEDLKTKDYLYGRLLAIAEYIEETALRVAGENRPTSAARLMQRFADRPFSTWRTIELGLQPYMQRLQANRTGFLVNRKKELDAVQAAFAPEDFADDKALTGEFLLGYHCQKQAWTKSNNDNQETEIEIEGE